MADDAASIARPTEATQEKILVDIPAGAVLGVTLNYTEHVGCSTGFKTVITNYAGGCQVKVAIGKLSGNFGEIRAGFRRVLVDDCGVDLIEMHTVDLDVDRVAGFEIVGVLGDGMRSRISLRCVEGVRDGADVGFLTIEVFDSCVDVPSLFSSICRGIGATVTASYTRDLAGQFCVERSSEKIMQGGGGFPVVRASKKSVDFQPICAACGESFNEENVGKQCNTCSDFVHFNCECPHYGIVVEGAVAESSRIEAVVVDDSTDKRWLEKCPLCGSKMIPDGANKNIMLCSSMTCDVVVEDRRNLASMVDGKRLMDCDDCDLEKCLDESCPDNAKNLTRVDEKSADVGDDKNKKIHDEKTTKDYEILPRVSVAKRGGAE